MDNKCSRFSDRYYARGAVANPVRLVERWRAAQEQALSLELCVLLRQLSCLANGASIIIRRLITSK